MRRRLSLAVAVLCIACSSACATIVHGTKQDVTITSDPASAKVTVLSIRNGSTVVRSEPGVTPLQVKLTRGDPHMTIRFEKDGCAPIEIPVKRSVSGSTFWNLVFVNPFAGQGADSPEAAGSIYILQVLTAGAGFLIDRGTGAAFKVPKTVHATLCAAPQTAQCAKGCSAR